MQGFFLTLFRGIEHTASSAQQLRLFQPHNAKRFYGVLTAASVIGLLLNFVKIDPIRALFWSAVINGVVAVPVMVVVMLLSANRKVMGEFCIPTPLKIMGWIASATTLLGSVACS